MKKGRKFQKLKFRVNRHQKGWLQNFILNLDWKPRICTAMQKKSAFQCVSYTSSVWKCLFCLQYQHIRPWIFFILERVDNYLFFSCWDSGIDYRIIDGKKGSSIRWFWRRTYLVLKLLVSFLVMPTDFSLLLCAIYIVFTQSLHFTLFPLLVMTRSLTSMSFALLQNFTSNSEHVLAIPFISETKFDFNW